MIHLIKVKHKGSFNHLERFLNTMKDQEFLNIAEMYGKEGVDALAKATPKDSGKTADSWDFEITSERGKTSIDWTNDNVNDGVNVAVLLQYGHGLDGGGYVPGQNYINPAMDVIAKRLADAEWEEVKKA